MESPWCSQGGEWQWLCTAGAHSANPPSQHRWEGRFSIICPCPLHTLLSSAVRFPLSSPDMSSVSSLDPREGQQVMSPSLAQLRCEPSWREVEPGAGIPREQFPNQPRKEGRCANVRAVQQQRDLSVKHLSNGTGALSQTLTRTCSLSPLQSFSEREA